MLRSKIPAIIAQAEARAELAVAKTSADVEAGAKDRSRVDTGQMQSGWHTRVVGRLEHSVENPIEHSIYNEFGTTDMSAQPMAVPAAEAARPGFESAMRQVYG